MGRQRATRDTNPRSGHAPKTGWESARRAEVCPVSQRVGGMLHQPNLWWRDELAWSEVLQMTGKIGCDGVLGL
jgi:hypothetical protein